MVDVFSFCYQAVRFLAFFGDKIAILTMKMIFYKLLAIAAGIQLLKSNLCEKKTNAGFSENVKQKLRCTTRY